MPVFFFQKRFPPTILIYFSQLCLRKNDVYIRVRVENGKSGKKPFFSLKKKRKSENK